MNHALNDDHEVIAAVGTAATAYNVVVGPAKIRDAIDSRVVDRTDTQCSIRSYKD
jgi:hypothetical protein